MKIETANGHGLNPYQCLMHVFTELPKEKTVEDFEALLPDKIKCGGWVAFTIKRLSYRNGRMCHQTVVCSEFRRATVPY